MVSLASWVISIKILQFPSCLFRSDSSVSIVEPILRTSISVKALGPLTDFLTDNPTSYFIVRQRR